MARARLSCIANTLVVDGLATQGARVSAAMILTKLSFDYSDLTTRRVNEKSIALSKCFGIDHYYHDTCGWSIMCLVRGWYLITSSRHFNVFITTQIGIVCYLRLIQDQNWAWVHLWKLNTCSRFPQIPVCIDSGVMINDSRIFIKYQFQCSKFKI